MKVREFCLVFDFSDERTGSIAGMQTCRADYQRDKWALQVSIIVHKTNECHKRERQVNQSHALGRDNFNGAEEVGANEVGSILLLHRLVLSFTIVNSKDASSKCNEKRAQRWDRKDSLPICEIPLFSQSRLLLVITVHDTLTLLCSAMHSGLV